MNQQTWKSCTRSPFAVSQEFSVRTLETFALRHPRPPRVIFTILESGFLVKSDYVHFVGGRWVLDASGNSWIWRIDSLSVWTALVDLDLIEDIWDIVRNRFQEGKFSKFGTWTSVGGSVSVLPFWLSATEKPAAKVKSRSKIFIVFLSWKTQSERPYAVTVDDREIRTW